MNKFVPIGLILVVGITIVGIGLVGAQGGPFGHKGQGPFTKHEFHRFGPSMNRFHFGPARAKIHGMFLHHHLKEGTSVEIAFYDGDPAEDASVVNTLTFLAGEDSARKTMKEFRETAKDAEFVEITVSAQSRTINLTERRESESDRGSEFKDGDYSKQRAGKPGNRMDFLLYSINEGSTLEAIFYDGNPEEGAGELSKLSFVAGEDSELAFKNAFAEAAKDSAYLVLNTSPQTHTINLAARKEKFEQFNGPQDPRNPKGPNDSGQSEP